jgi:hypothetical protein
MRRIEIAPSLSLPQNWEGDLETENSEQLIFKEQSV